MGNKLDQNDSTMHKTDKRLSYSYEKTTTHEESKLFNHSKIITHQGIIRLFHIDDCCI